LNSTKLTDKNFWDAYWEKYQLPLEMSKSKQNPFLNELLNTFDRYLPQDKSLSILEIGGSPGQYLAYFHRTKGYQLNCLDYSKIGCAKTHENFSLLGLEGNVYECDLFAKSLNLPKFDIVLSLGFIEHFSDTNLVIEKHLDLLKPQGILVLGVPNFIGINHFFLKHLAPDLLSKHNLKVMDLRQWQNFEETFNLEPIFKGYVGGFHPSTFNRIEKKSVVNLFLLGCTKILVFIFKKHLTFLRKFNSKNFSGYLFGFYRRGKSSIPVE
jgi:SAM-dependent methyltransferase